MCDITKNAHPKNKQKLYQPDTGQKTSQRETHPLKMPHNKRADAPGQKHNGTTKHQPPSAIGALKPSSPINFFYFQKKREFLDASLLQSAPHRHAEQVGA